MTDIERLGLLVLADEQAGEAQTWVLYPRGDGSGVWLSVVGWPEDTAPLTQHEIDDLADRGWLRVAKRDGNGRTFAVNGAGREAWATHVAQRTHEATEVDLLWSAARPVLERVYALYRQAGAPEMGVYVLQVTDGRDDVQQIEAIIRELTRDDWLVPGEGLGIGEPDTVRPTPKTVRALGGWPSGNAQDALQELVQDLDSEIDRTADEGARTKLLALRDGLLGAGRDVALAYFEKKVMGL